MATQLKKTSGRPKSSKGKNLPKKKCCDCLTEKPTDEFFKSNNPLYSDGLIPLCIDCFKERCYNRNTEDVDVESLKKLLRQVDRPFVLKYYNSAVDHCKEKFKDKNYITKQDKLRVVSEYMRIISSFKQFRNMTWDDGYAFEKENENTKIHVLVENPNVDDDLRKASDFKLTQEIIDLFGEGYTTDEYRKMAKKYTFLTENYPTTTNLHVEALVTYIKYKVKEEDAIERGDPKEAETWSKLALKAGEKARINPNQLTQQDLQGGTNSFSELFMAIEKAVDIVPLLPQFRYRPNDAPDFIIWCFVNYIRDLEGKELCTYEDVYKFYDDRVNDYIKEHGDPYGIFEGLTLDANRERIKEFIKLPEDEE